MIDVMIDLSNYRIIDLSPKILPDIRKVCGEYFHGDQIRLLRLDQFIYALDETFMHFVELETHIGSHVECPTHIDDAAKDPSELSLETFMGEAVLVDLSGKEKGEVVTIEDLVKADVHEGDIVILWSPYTWAEGPYVSEEAAEWLVKTRIKMIGVCGVRLERVYPPANNERLLIGNEIPLIEGLTNLEKIKKKRFFYFGLPLNIAGLDTSWIRAIAIEER